MAKSKRSNRDHAHQHQYPGLDNEVIASDLQALLTPALFAQQAYFRQLGMRERILNLSLMRFGGTDNVMAAGAKRAGVDSDISTGRLAVVQSCKSVPTGSQPTVP